MNLGLKCCLILLILAPGRLRADDELPGEEPLRAPPAKVAAGLVEVEKVVQRGLAGLASIQAASGAIGSEPAITSLAGMAFLAGGHTPGRGQHREVVRKALDYVLAAQNPADGYLGAQQGRMYGHGFATLFLAECYGTVPDRRIRQALDAALHLIYRAQNQEGGWRYNPYPDDADLSVTICQIMAVRAAFNAGLGGERSQQVMQKAIAYVRTCANANGAFSYMARDSGMDAGPGSVPRTAAGVMCLLGAGINEERQEPALARGYDYLRIHALNHLMQGGQWYWYGQYYVAQAMFRSPRRDDWTTYREATLQVLPSFQDARSGLWTGPDTSYGPAFATAVALIILQMPNEYLPIFQR